MRQKDALYFVQNNCLIKGSYHFINIKCTSNFYTVEYYQLFRKEYKNLEHNPYFKNVLNHLEHYPDIP